MLTLEEAYSKAAQNHSGEKVVSALDYGNYFAFKFVPTDSESDYIPGPLMDAVSKDNGEVYVFNPLENPEALDAAVKLSIPDSISHANIYDADLMWQRFFS